MALDKEAGERLWVSRWEAWKIAASTKHLARYTYPSHERVDGKIRIVCPDHGDFWQRPAGHKSGKGCARCAAGDQNPMETLKKEFPNLDFSQAVYTGSKAKLTIVCKEHGEFKRHFNALMGALKTEGRMGCQKCAADARGKSSRKALEVWDKQLKEVFPTYMFDLETLTNSATKMKVVCPEHGEFWSRPQDLLNGHGCPECGAKTRRENVSAAIRISFREYVLRAAAVHGPKYIYHTSSYDQQRARVKITCLKHGAFWQIARNHVALEASCPACANSLSHGEGEVADFLKGLGVEVEKRTRQRLCKQEIDIYLPAFNIGVEYCGTYWQSEERLPNRYHLAKLEDAEVAGIRLIQIFEDEWLFRREVVEARLRNILGVTERAVGARSLTLREVPWLEAKAFLETWHLQGAGKPAASCWALCKGDEILACATFGKARFGEEGAELLRFAASCSVQGGFSRLIKAYARSNLQVQSLTSYADRRWSDGRVYLRNGFQFKGNSRPGYWWCKNSQRYNRHMFQKHKLPKMLKKYDPQLSEIQNCKANGYFRLFDCGVSRWTLSL